MPSDLRVRSGATIEAKGQPIDPTRYQRNFVEVFEVTHNPRHSGGLDEVAALLGFDRDDLEAMPVRLRDGRRQRVGYHECVSVSIKSIANSALTAYINYLMGGKFIYLYERTELVNAIRRGARDGFARGAGNSNDDTFAVFVPLARCRWARDHAGWRYIGDGSESDAIDAVTNALS